MSTQKRLSPKNLSEGPAMDTENSQGQKRIFKKSINVLFSAKTEKSPTDNMKNVVVDGGNSGACHKKSLSVAVDQALLDDGNEIDKLMSSAREKIEEFQSLEANKRTSDAKKFFKASSRGRGRGMPPRRDKPLGIRDSQTVDEEENGDFHNCKENFENATPQLPDLITCQDNRGRTKDSSVDTIDSMTFSNSSLDRNPTKYSQSRETGRDITHLPGNINNSPRSLLDLEFDNREKLYKPASDSSKNFDETCHVNNTTDSKKEHVVEKESHKKDRKNKSKKSLLSPKKGRRSTEKERSSSQVEKRKRQTTKDDHHARRKGKDVEAEGRFDKLEELDQPQYLQNEKQNYRETEAQEIKVQATLSSQDDQNLETDVHLLHPKDVSYQAFQENILTDSLSEFDEKQSSMFSCVNRQVTALYQTFQSECKDGSVARNEIENRRRWDNRNNGGFRDDCVVKNSTIDIKSIGTNGHNNDSENRKTVLPGIKEHDTVSNQDDFNQNDPKRYQMSVDIVRHVDNLSLKNENERNPLEKEAKNLVVGTKSDKLALRDSQETSCAEVKNIFERLSNSYKEDVYPDLCDDFDSSSDLLENDFVHSPNSSLPRIMSELNNVNESDKYRDPPLCAEIIKSNVKAASLSDHPSRSEYTAHVSREQHSQSESESLPTKCDDDDAAYDHQQGPYVTNSQHLDYHMYYWHQEHPYRRDYYSSNPMMQHPHPHYPSASLPSNIKPMQRLFLSSHGYPGEREKVTLLLDQCMQYLHMRSHSSNLPLEHFDIVMDVGVRYTPPASATSPEWCDGEDRWFSAGRSDNHSPGSFASMFGMPPHSSSMWPSGPSYHMGTSQAAEARRHTYNQPGAYYTQGPPFPEMYSYQGRQRRSENSPPPDMVKRAAVEDNGSHNNPSKLHKTGSDCQPGEELNAPSQAKPNRTPKSKSSQQPVNRGLGLSAFLTPERLGNDWSSQARSRRASQSPANGATPKSESRTRSPFATDGVRLRPDTTTRNSPFNSDDVPHRPGGSSIKTSPLWESTKPTEEDTTRCPLAELKHPPHPEKERPDHAWQFPPWRPSAQNFRSHKQDHQSDSPLTSVPKPAVEVNKPVGDDSVRDIPLPPRTPTQTAHDGSNTPFTSPDPWFPQQSLYPPPAKESSRSESDNWRQHCNPLSPGDGKAAGDRACFTTATDARLKRRSDSQLNMSSQLQAFRSQQSQAYRKGRVSDGGSVPASGDVVTMRQAWMKEFHERSKTYNHGFVDTHCHLDLLYNRLPVHGCPTFSRFKQENSDYFPSNFDGCVAVFCYPHTYDVAHPRNKILKTVEDDPDVWLAIGCHPKTAEEFGERHLFGLKQALKSPKVVALGEIGLDYSKHFGEKAEVQKRVLVAQLELALEMKLPIVIHCRDADDDCLEILQKMVPREHKIHAHCFTRNYDVAQRWLNAFPNLWLGLTPLISSPKHHTSQGARHTALHTPLNRILLETDAPYFVPHAIRNSDVQLSYPGFALHTAEIIAKLKRISVDEVLKACRQNTRDMYGI